MRATQPLSLSASMENLPRDQIRRLGIMSHCVDLMSWMSAQRKRDVSGVDTLRSERHR